LLWGWRCALALLPLLLLGCATPPQTAALQARPVAAVRLTLPFVPQDDYQCGPAALQMALRASGAQVDLQTLVAQVFLPARQGSLQPEMLATARRHGRLALMLPPQLDAVLAELHAGHPVIVLQNLALPIAPRWHYAVVIGYDPTQQELILHSGTTASLRMPLAVFERTWARSGHWAMVATRPNAPAASPSTDALVQAAVALERVDTAAALRAYRALTQRDVTSYGAWFGLGTAALREQDVATARDALGRAVALRPDAADAWNNLALAHLHAREAARALEAAQRAVALGGPRAERYQATLAAARQALQPTPGPQPR
jgi:tetratricopeptide (TPR) repeat protein